MGLFSKILPALEVVGGIALIATGAGALAGGLLITQGLASSGLIGGSVGKFLKSDVGQGLMMAASLGSTAYAMFGQSALQSAGTELSNTVADQASEAAGQAGASSAGNMVEANQAAADASGSLAKTGVSFSNSVGVNTAAFPDASTAAYNGAPMTEMTGSTAVSDNISPQANLAQTQALNADRGAVAQASGQSMPGMGEGAPSSYNGSAPAGNTGQPTGNFGTTPPQGAAPPDSLAAPTGPNAPTMPSSGPPSPDLEGASYAQAHGMPYGNPDAAATDTSGGGFGSNLLKFANTKLGQSAIQGAGSAIGGLGQGMMQEAAMNKQLNFLREPNQSFGGPAGQQVLAASQSPITVPSGYLQRAQALKQMLGSNGAGAVPSANSPVPVWGMGSTPRGGVPGG